MTLPSRYGHYIDQCLEHQLMIEEEALKIQLK